MKKLNDVIYKKLLLQAEEAKEQGMAKLANSIFEAIGSHPNDVETEYSCGELRDDINKDLWKMATRLMYYYDVESADAEKINTAIVSIASKLMNDLEIVLNVDDVIIGPLEPKLFGEDK